MGFVKTTVPAVRLTYCAADMCELRCPTGWPPVVLAPVPTRAVKIGLLGHRSGITMKASGVSRSVPTTRYRPHTRRREDCTHGPHLRAVRLRATYTKQMYAYVCPVATVQRRRCPGVPAESRMHPLRLVGSAGGRSGRKAVECNRAPRPGDATGSGRTRPAPRRGMSPNRRGLPTRPQASGTVIVDPPDVSGPPVLTRSPTMYIVEHGRTVSRGSFGRPGLIAATAEIVRQSVGKP